MTLNHSTEIQAYFSQILQSRGLSVADLSSTEKNLSSAALEALAGKGLVERIPLKDIHRILNALKITPEEYREFHRLFEKLNSALLRSMSG